jgi:hypothetical protein
MPLRVHAAVAADHGAHGIRIQLGKRVDDVTQGEGEALSGSAEPLRRAKHLFVIGHGRQLNN